MDDANAMINSAREPDSMMEMVITALFCALLGLACVGGMAWAVVGGEDVGVGRIFLLLVWLVLALLFFGMAAWIARQALLLNPGKKEQEATVPDASERSAAKAPAGQEKAGNSVS